MKSPLNKAVLGLCAAVLALAGLACSSRSDDTDNGPQPGDLLCIVDTSAFPINVTASRVYEVVDGPNRGNTATVIDVTPEDADTEDAVAIDSDYLEEIAHKVSSDRRPGDRC